MIPCQVQGHDHVGASESSTGYQLPFCAPHFDALPDRLAVELLEVAQETVFDTLAQATARALVAKAKKRLESRIGFPGICRECGCTEEFACDGGCAWVNRRRTLCSACAKRLPAKKRGRVKL